MSWMIDPFFHVMDDCSERPVCFASCLLTNAEEKNSQLDKEGLVNVFAVNNYAATLTIVLPEEGLLSGGQNVVTFTVQPALNVHSSV